MIIRNFVLALALFLAAGTMVACGDDDGGNGGNGGNGDGEFTFPDDPFNLRRCPEISEFPQLQIEEGLLDTANERTWSTRPREQSFVRDIVGNVNQDQVVVGQLLRANTANLPNSGRGIVNEKVYVFVEEEGDWVKAGEAMTDSTGAFSYELPAEHQFEPGLHRFLVIVAASGTCFEAAVALWPEGVETVFTDIDGTLSANDQEFLTQLFTDIHHTPAKNEAAVEMMNAWADKGFEAVYLTARPNVFRWQTRVWLREEGFPFGAVETAEEFVHGETARAYKRGFVNHATTEWDFQIIAAYGNAGSDVEAYEDAGIPKNVTFTINEAEGDAGTVGIPNGSFTDHISGHIASHRDSNN